MNIQGDLQRLQATDIFSTSTAAKKTPAAEPSAAGQASVTDQTHLSGAATAASQAVGQPDVRLDKIASVQSAIANGTYNVSSSEVAGKLIESMRESVE